MSKSQERQPQSCVPQFGGELGLGRWSLDTSGQCLWTEGWRGGQGQEGTQLRSMGLVLRIRNGHWRLPGLGGRERCAFQRESTSAGVREDGSAGVEQRWRTILEGIEDEERGKDVSSAEGSRSSGLGELGCGEAPLATPWSRNSFTVTHCFPPTPHSIIPSFAAEASLCNPPKPLIITPPCMDSSKF